MSEFAWEKVFFCHFFSVTHIYHAHDFHKSISIHWFGINLRSSLNANVCFLTFVSLNLTKCSSAKQRRYLMSKGKEHRKLFLPQTCDGKQVKEKTWQVAMQTSLLWCFILWHTINSLTLWLLHSLKGLGKKHPRDDSKCSIRHILHTCSASSPLSFLQSRYHLHFWDLSRGCHSRTPVIDINNIILSKCI